MDRFVSPLKPGYREGIERGGSGYELFKKRQFTNLNRFLVKFDYQMSQKETECHFHMYSTKEKFHVSPAQFPNIQPGLTTTTTHCVSNL